MPLLNYSSQELAKASLKEKEMTVFREKYISPFLEVIKDLEARIQYF